MRDCSWYLRDNLESVLSNQWDELRDLAYEGSTDFIPALHYEWRSLSPTNRRRVVALKDRYDALWQRLIDELQHAGHMPGDAHLMRLLILGAVNWTGAWYRQGGRLSLDEVAAGAARLFLRHNDMTRRGLD